MDVKVETRITQVSDGSEYKGYIKIGQSTLNWQMILSIPVNQLDKELPKRKDEPMINLFQIKMERDGNQVVLADDEHRIFVRLLLMKVVEFYNLPQTRNSNDGMMGATLRGKGWKDAMPNFGIEISVLNTVSYGLPQEICELLNRPKFDCALAA